MRHPLRQGKDTFFTIATGVALVVGFSLRLYLLKDQVLLNDEWHGLYFVIGKSPAWMLTHFSIPGATCIPLNLYTWAVGITIGWSEMVLRLPSLVCGVLCVLVGPLLARDLIGPRRAGGLALLLAISPLLIFYSRICRPYSAEVLMGFATILAAARWMRFCDRRSAVLFVGTGVLAVYFHLFAIVAVAAPILTALAYYYLRAYWLRTPRAASTMPPLRHWIVAAAIIAVLSMILVLPALIHSLDTTFFTIAFKGTFELQSLPVAALLISGTGKPVLALLFWVALIIGAIEQCRRSPWFGGMLVSLYPLYALALILSQPNSVQAAIVLVRYSIPLVPVSLLLVACGIQATSEAITARVKWRPAFQALAVFACVTVLALTGPLPERYAAPNNFTNHSVYQERYGRIDWSHSFYSDLAPAGLGLNTVIRADEIPPFYRMLAKHPDGRPIVEYPMLIGDQFNLLYYYQHFHRRPVLVGYTTDMMLSPKLPPGNVYGNTCIDQVLSLVKGRIKLRFHNLVPMDDLAAMRARQVEYIIMHKRFGAQLSELTPPLPDFNRLCHEYEKKLGPPVYDDHDIIVFRF